MPSRTNSRNTPIACFLFGSVLILSAMAAGAQAVPAAASGLPPTAPTTAPPQANSLPAPISATQISSKDAVPRSKAKVAYSGGLLDVEANNSSLNGILRDIAQLTGMKITGGVADQRVFGNYGPATPATVLATLLDGTGSNMMLKETSTNNGPAELILTPRTGGPTPPNPAAAYDESEEAMAPPPQQPDQQPQPVPAGQAAQARQSPSGPPSAPQPWNNVQGSPSNTTLTAGQIPSVTSISLDALPVPASSSSPSGIVDSTNPPPPGSTGFGSATPLDPAVNAEKTPEQIYQQLQQLRQAAAAQQSGATNSNSSTTPATTPIQH